MSDDCAVIEHQEEPVNTPARKNVSIKDVPKAPKKAVKTKTIAKETTKKVAAKNKRSITETKVLFCCV